MDSFARGLKNAAKLIEDGTLDSLVKVSSNASLRALLFLCVYQFCQSVNFPASVAFSAEAGILKNAILGCTYLLRSLFLIRLTGILFISK